MSPSWSGGCGRFLSLREGQAPSASTSEFVCGCVERLQHCRERVIGAVSTTPQIEAQDTSVKGAYHESLLPQRQPSSIRTRTRKRPRPRYWPLLIRPAAPGCHPRRCLLASCQQHALLRTLARRHIGSIALGDMTGLGDDVSRDTENWLLSCAPLPGPLLLTDLPRAAALYSSIQLPFFI